MAPLPELWSHQVLKTQDACNHILSHSSCTALQSWLLIKRWLHETFFSALCFNVYGPHCWAVVVLIRLNCELITEELHQFVWNSSSVARRFSCVSASLTQQSSLLFTSLPPGMTMFVQNHNFSTVKSNFTASGKFHLMGNNGRGLHFSSEFVCLEVFAIVVCSDEYCHALFSFSLCTDRFCHGRLCTGHPFFFALLKRLYLFA